MMFTEVFVPRGALVREQLARLAQRLTMRGLYGGPDGEPGPTDPGVLEFLESITHVVVHEVDLWVAGGRPMADGGPPRYVVRVHVPGAWRKDLSGSLVERVTRALAEVDPEPERLYDKPCAEVHVLGVPEGGYGVFGRVVGQSAMSELISAARSGTAKPPAGMAVDPVCGCTVPLDGTLTVDLDGVTYAFCCEGCRRHFRARQQDTADAR